MKIAFDHENMLGAERYIAQSGITHPDGAGTWLELAVVKQFVDLRSAVPEFTTVYKGIGFFWQVEGTTTAPLLQTAVDADEGDLPELISITFWVAADVVAD